MLNNFEGVSEDETEDMMEEDHRPFEDALVDAEDDLQQDDIAANDVQAERKSRPIHSGMQSFLSIPVISVPNNGTCRDCIHTGMFLISFHLKERNDKKIDTKQ